jgi:hypothetical protein
MERIVRLVGRGFTIGHPTEGKVAERFDRRLRRKPGGQRKSRAESGRNSGLTEINRFC